MNVHRDLDELFDMDAPTKVKSKIEDLANQLLWYGVGGKQAHGQK